MEVNLPSAIRSPGIIPSLVSQITFFNSIPFYDDLSAFGSSIVLSWLGRHSGTKLGG